MISTGRNNITKKCYSIRFPDIFLIKLQFEPCKIKELHCKTGIQVVFSQLLVCFLWDTNESFWITRVNLVMLLINLTQGACFLDELTSINIFVLDTIYSLCYNYPSLLLGLTLSIDSTFTNVHDDGSILKKRKKNRQSADTSLKAQNTGKQK